MFEQYTQTCLTIPSSKQILIIKMLKNCYKLDVYTTKTIRTYILKCNVCKIL